MATKKAVKKADAKESKPQLEWKRENGWNKLDAAEQKAVEAYSAGYIGYLSASKTEWEAHDEAVVMLKKAGYKDLAALPSKAGTLKPGSKVYLSCRGKTLMAAVVGKKPVAAGLHVVGGHTDAPRLDAKPNPIYEDAGMALLDTHYYGGIKKYQWVAMPLAIHGIAVKEDGKKVKFVIGEKATDPVFVISDLLPHLGKDQAKLTLSEGIKGEGLNVMLGTLPVADKKAQTKVKLAVLQKLWADYGINEEDLISADIEIVPAGPARESGLDRSMILGYGHDDRVCAYAGLRALMDLKGAPEFTSMVLLCDKEEIGSVGATGMQSVFFENAVAELLVRQGADYSDLVRRRCLERSRMISADVTAAHDPNYPDVSSPNNTAILNGGVAVAKYTGHGGKSGSSEASAEFMAEIRRIFNGSKVLWQTAELGKVDQGGGGTIALLLARYGMDVVDAGVPLLSMHAPWELATKLDCYMSYKAYREFFAHRHG